MTSKNQVFDWVIYTYIYYNIIADNQLSLQIQSVFCKNKNKRVKSERKRSDHAYILLKNDSCHMRCKLRCAIVLVHTRSTVNCGSSTYSASWSALKSSNTPE